ncbi:MAG: YggS family pyridoxal phosphate-dependent enzyme [Eubacterium sp.]|nr:YggS family pyridoxal phosphate-dependent enzyme [Eubacterium sp.]
MIEENYRKVEEKVRAAAVRSGRQPEDVTLIAVSKTKPLSDIEALIRIGVREFGENKPQELKEKYDSVSQPVHFHQIGHLQTNKVKYVIDRAVLIHSVDSVHLAEQIQKEAEKRGLTTEVLIEVNAAGEDTKFGVSIDETEPLVREIAKFPNIRIRGLMTIAPFVDDPEENRAVFRAMKQLLLDIKSQKIDNVDMSVLSMGMTNDYEVAIEEGATMVRVGTAIFGERNYDI